MVASTNWMKLLAAGCVAGILSGASVQANAVEVVAAGPVAVQDGDGYGFDDNYDGDGGEIDGGFDVFAVAPAQEPAEEPEVAVLPEEEATAPDAEEETADVEGLPDADPDALMELGYSVTQNIDYIPGPGKLAIVGDIDALAVMSAEDCAVACTAEENCNLAAYFTVAPGGSEMNCFVKGLDPGCTLPADTDVVENGWLLLSTLRCEVTVPGTDAATPAATVADAPAAAVAPAAAGTGVYTQHPGFDYIPSADGDANSVTVTDIGDGLLVTTVEECEDACDAEALCNAVSFYIEPLEATGLNCYLKTLGDACELPDDAIADPLAILSLKCDAAAPTAVDGLADAPTAAIAPAAAPISDDPLTDDVAGTDLPTTDTDTDGEVVEQGSSAGGMCVGVAAMAAAGVVALM